MPWYIVHAHYITLHTHYKCKRWDCTVDAPPQLITRAALVVECCYYNVSMNIYVYIYVYKAMPVCIFRRCNTYAKSERREIYKDWFLYRFRPRDRFARARFFFFSSSSSFFDSLGYNASGTTSVANFCITSVCKRVAAAIVCLQNSCWVQIYIYASTALPILGAPVANSLFFLFSFFLKLLFHACDTVASRNTKLRL